MTTKLNSTAVHTSTNFHYISCLSFLMGMSWTRPEVLTVQVALSAPLSKLIHPAQEWTIIGMVLNLTSVVVWLSHCLVHSYVVSLKVADMYSNEIQL